MDHKCEDPNAVTQTRTFSATLAVLAALLAGCGDAAPDRAAAPRGAAALKGDPALARAPRRPGEFVLRAAASPQTHGPIALDGRYRVRFEQYAPEDPQLDFGDQTTFTVDLRRPGARTGQALFSAARATGTRTLTLHGRYVVDVTFGDFPYVLRFTPASS